MLNVLIMYLLISENDDLLNFDIGDGDFADGQLNEDELLLSDDGEYY